MPKLIFELLRWKQTYHFQCLFSKKKKKQTCHCLFCKSCLKQGSKLRLLACLSFHSSVVCYWSQMLNCVHYFSYLFVSFQVCEEDWLISGFFVDMEFPKHIYGKNLEFLLDAVVERGLWYMFLRPDKCEIGLHVINCFDLLFT